MKAEKIPKGLLTIEVQQAFSRIVPQQPKKATTKTTQPMTMMQMGIVCGLNDENAE